MFVGLSSYAVAGYARSPMRACALPVPAAHGACANLAAGTFAARRAKQPQATPLSVERKQARDGYRVEPLSASALSVLIVSASDKSADGIRPALLQLAGKITRRSSLINAEQIRSAGLRDDKKAFFQWMSRSISTSNEARKSYVGVMADATGMDGAIEALTPAIGANPEWADDYWSAVVSRPKSLANAARLRMAVTGAPWSQKTISVADKRLVQELVNNYQFDEARTLATKLSAPPEPAAGRSNRLVNGRYSRQPVFVPFDWELATSGNLGASIEDKKQRLLISAIGGAQGLAARQLVGLLPGNYDLRWTLSESGEGGALPLRIRLFCAERDAEGASSSVIPLTVGKRQVPVKIADSGCRWYWLTVDVSLPDDSAGIDLYLQNVSLVPATGAAGGSLS